MSKITRRAEKWLNDPDAFDDETVQELIVEMLEEIKRLEDELKQERFI